MPSRTSMSESPKPPDPKSKSPSPDPTTASASLSRGFAGASELYNGSSNDDSTTSATLARQLITQLNVPTAERGEVSDGCDWKVWERVRKPNQKHAGRRSPGCIVEMLQVRLRLHSDQKCPKDESSAIAGTVSTRKGIPM